MKLIIVFLSLFASINSLADECVDFSGIYYVGLDKYEEEKYLKVEQYSCSTLLGFSGYKYSTELKERLVFNRNPYIRYRDNTETCSPFGFCNTASFEESKITVEYNYPGNYTRPDKIKCKSTSAELTKSNHGKLVIVHDLIDCEDNKNGKFKHILPTVVSE